MAGCDCLFGLEFDAIILGFCYARGAFLFLLIIFIIPLAKAHPQPVSFDYTFSNNAAHAAKHLHLQGNVSLSSSGIHLAVDSNDNGDGGSVGRVTIPQAIHLWNKTSNELKSFTTHFSFKISSKSWFSPLRGEGLTFFLANWNLANVVNDELKRGGLGIGRVNVSNPLPTEYQFVAVEFDTFSNQWDPAETHVGVNVNSMQSEIVEEWNTDVSSSGGSYECSIEYSSGDCRLNVSFSGFDLDGERVMRHLPYHIDLRDYLHEWVVVGISAATGDGYEEHILMSWSFNKTTSDDADQTKEKMLDKKMLLEGIGIGLGGCMCVSLCVLVIFLLRKRDKGKEKEVTSETASDLRRDDEFQMGIGPKKISYEELVSATNNFEETQKLGKDGFGCVYKGYFKDSDSYAAIKRISSGSTYASEVMIISQLRHRNLVKLMGWCHKKNHLFLIYEYMPNGSLCSHLFRGVKSILPWHVRYKIALGLASALFYLQEEWEKCVLHRDIKSSNIMLDSNFNAKLGDFGLARLVDHEKGSHSHTTYHLAPEYMSTGKARKESDMFSFGIVLLEVASGKKSIFHHKEKKGQVSLVEWVWELYRLRNLLAAADPKLHGEFDVKQMECLLVVGLWCANPDSRSRPSIKQVIKVLNFEAPFPIPPLQIPVIYSLSSSNYS